MHDFYHDVTRRWATCLGVNPACLLLASACLLIAPDLGWQPPENIGNLIATDSLTKFLNLFDFSIWLAGTAGLFICFWPGRRPGACVLISVCLPSIAATTLFTGRLIFDRGRAFSVLLSTVEEVLKRPVWVCSAIWNIGPRVHYAVAGCTLAVIYVMRPALKSGGSCILPEPSRPDIRVSQEEWRRARKFVWISIVIFVPLQILFRLVSHSLDLQYLLFFATFGRAIDLVIPTLLLVWLIGSTWRCFWAEALHIPPFKYWVGGAGLAIGIGSFFLLCNIISSFHSAGPLLKQLILAAHVHVPPVIALYFLLAALLEEIGYRGFLLPRFVRRFGMMRGILFVGLSWAATHLYVDLSYLTNDWAIVFYFVPRIIGLIAVNFVLAWLTLRSSSILPAALAHGIDNIMNSYVTGGGLAWSAPLQALAWVIVALILLHYWPLPTSPRAP